MGALSRRPPGSQRRPLRLYPPRPAWLLFPIARRPTRVFSGKRAFFARAGILRRRGGPVIAGSSHPGPKGKHAQISSYGRGWMEPNDGPRKTATRRAKAIIIPDSIAICARPRRFTNRKKRVRHPRRGRANRIGGSMKEPASRASEVPPRHLDNLSDGKPQAKR